MKCGGPAARQDSAVAHRTPVGRDQARHHREDHDGKTCQRYALERAQDGQGYGGQPS